VFYDPLTYLERQVQTGEARVGVLEGFNNAQGVEIVLETLSVAPHQAVQFLLARMGKRGVADVVG
jgi:hypothetical protein